MFVLKSQSVILICSFKPAHIVLNSHNPSFISFLTALFHILCLHIFACNRGFHCFKTSDLKKTKQNKTKSM